MSPKPVAPRQKQRIVLKSITTSLCLLLWLSLSSGIILFNKWILNPQRFPYPVTLAFWHMLFCSFVGLLVVQCRCISKQNVTWSTCIKICFPVGALGAAGLTLGNAAFLYLSVAFAQMLKANMPVIMFVVGCLFRFDKFSWESCGIMVIIGAGVTVSSLGELQFSAIGASFMLLAMLSEAFKMILLQSMMQRTELRINPINALYYVMPASTLCLLPFVITLEARDVYDNASLIQPQIPVLVASAFAACLLNVIAFWVVSNTSALTMKLAGIVKDAILIVSSALLFGTQLTLLSVGGYGVALTGIVIHNYQSAAQAQPESGETKAQDSLVIKPLLNPHKHAEV